MVHNKPAWLLVRLGDRLGRYGRLILTVLGRSASLTSSRYPSLLCRALIIFLTLNLYQIVYFYRTSTIHRPATEGQYLS